MPAALRERIEALLRDGRNVAVQRKRARLDTAHERMDAQKAARAMQVIALMRGKARFDARVWQSERTHHAQLLDGRAAVQARRARARACARAASRRRPPKPKDVPAGAPLFDAFASDGGGALGEARASAAEPSGSAGRAEGGKDDDSFDDDDDDDDFWDEEEDGLQPSAQPSAEASTAQPAENRMSDAQSPDDSTSRADAVPVEEPAGPAEAADDEPAPPIQRADGAPIGLARAPDDAPMVPADTKDDVPATPAETKNEPPADPAEMTDDAPAKVTEPAAEAAPATADPSDALVTESEAKLPRLAPIDRQSARANRQMQSSTRSI